MYREYGAQDERAAFLSSGAVLAYIGDAVYEMLAREYALGLSLGAKQMHAAATGLVSASAQFRAYKAIAVLLTEPEKEMFARGRNADVSAPKRRDPVVNCHATGLETLFGYLYLSGQNERIKELFNVILDSEKAKK